MSNQKRGIHLIAELAKVSIGTVDRALHNGEKSTKIHGGGFCKLRSGLVIRRIWRRVRYPLRNAAPALACASLEKSASFTTSFGAAFWTKLAVSDSLASGSSTVLLKPFGKAIQKHSTSSLIAGFRPSFSRPETHAVSNRLSYEGKSKAFA